MTLRLLDLFSGIGGFSYAAEYLVGGYETVAFVEREPYCQKILRQHWPSVPIHDDICTFNPERRSADVICGGFPCQDISTAGKQAGIKQGTRSGLFYQLMRIVRLVEPRYVVLENVAAILNNGLDIVLGELAEAGFDAEWACIPASAVGACHQRDRWWLVAYPQSQQCHGDKSGNSEGAARATAQFRNCYGANASNTDDSGLQRQRRKHELLESSRKGPFTWGRRGSMLNPEWGGYLSKPVLCRGDDGLSGRVDRLKALGNAVVPQVAAIPLQRVIEIHAQTKNNQAVN
jgi:DNA (cytosine-5)-methyltransferase 1